MKLFMDSVITDHWGLNEACGNASRCSEGIYHVDSEFGIIECYDGESHSGGRKTGNMLCTGFTNHSFPFIRYEVGDIATWEKEDALCKCGRSTQQICQIEGRTHDRIINLDGSRVGGFVYVFKNSTNIKEAQVAQYKEGAVVLKIVRAPEYGSKDERKLRQLIKNWSNPSLGVDFEYVREIEREPNGKFLFMKSYLTRDSEDTS